MTHRSGYVAIIGRPNVGKSTLLNRLVGQKISITSRRPQTTRQRIIGIVTRADAQYVFVDTPGFQNRHGNVMNRLMNRSVSRSIADVNVIVWVVEARHLTAEDKAVLGLLQDCAPVVIAVNKIDELANKNELLPFMQELETLAHPAAIVPVSAKNGVGADNLLDAIAGFLPEQDRLYAEDEITTASERTLAAELVGKSCSGCWARNCRIRRPWRSRNSRSLTACAGSMPPFSSTRPARRASSSARVVKN